MSELEALNMLLRLIGSPPVNDVTTNHPDAANARATLNRQRNQLQKRGWWYNLDYNLIYQPDIDGRIRIADEITTIIMEDKSLIKRGKFLYDKQTQTYNIGVSVCAYRTVRVLDWDDMPDVMQDYVAYKAGVQFVRDELEDAGKERSVEIDAQRAELAVKKQDLEEGRYNIRLQARVLRARGGVRPYERRYRYAQSSGFTR